jgi:hypothetical protein
VTKRHFPEPLDWVGLEMPYPEAKVELSQAYNKRTYMMSGDGQGARMVLLRGEAAPVLCGNRATSFLKGASHGASLCN